MSHSFPTTGDQPLTAEQLAKATGKAAFGIQQLSYGNVASAILCFESAIRALKGTTFSIPIPEGWRVLGPNERLEQGDRCFASDWVVSGNWSDKHGGKQAPACRPYIRKI